MKINAVAIVVVLLAVTAFVGAAPTNGTMSGIAVVKSSGAPLGTVAATVGEALVDDAAKVAATGDKAAAEPAEMPMLLKELHNDGSFSGRLLVANEDEAGAGGAFAIAPVHWVAVLLLGVMAAKFTSNIQ